MKRDNKNRPDPAKPDPQKGPVMSVGCDLADFMDSPGVGYEGGDVLDLGEFGCLNSLDPFGPMLREPDRKP